MVNSWSLGRPLYNRLPSRGYQDNDVSDWLTKSFDDVLVETKNKVDAMPLNLHPDTCPDKWLDFLGWLSGFNGRYWSKSWKPSIKRALIKAGLSWLWKNKGTKRTLSFVLEQFLGKGNFDIWTHGSFVVNSTELPGKLGVPEFKYYIRLPVEFRRQGMEFKNAELINSLYGAAFCETKVVYDGFYCNISEVDDIIFSDEDKINNGTL